MKKKKGLKLVAFALATVMTMSVMFQTPWIIPGLEIVQAAVGKDLSNTAEYELFVDIMEYNGTAQTPNVTVGVWNGLNFTSQTLDPSNYTISVNTGGSTVTNAGEYTVRVTGAGSYTGSLTKTFTVKRKKVTTSALCWSTDGSTYTPITTSTLATINKNGMSVEYYPYAMPQSFKLYYKTTTNYYEIPTSHYTMTVMNNNGGVTPYTTETITTSNLGTNFPQVNISFNSNSNVYTDKAISHYYRIEKADISKQTIKLSTNSFAYTGSVQKPTVTIINEHGTVKETLKEGTDYTVSLASGSDGKSAKTQTLEIKATDNSNYTGTATVTYTILSSGVQTISLKGATVTVSDCTYNGGEQKPVPTVTLNGQKVDASNYVVTYSNNTNARSKTESNAPTVTITGKNQYVDSCTAKFTIAKRNISNAQFLNLSTAIYNPSGNAIPSYSVYDSGIGKTLEVGTAKDYTVSYTNANKVGTATITITGVNNYTGTKSENFQVVSDYNSKGESLSDAEVSFATIPDTTYNGTPIEPVPTVYYNGVKVDPGQYTVSYEANHTNVGNHIVTITAKSTSKYVANSTNTAVYKIVPVNVYSNNTITGITVSGATKNGTKYYIADQTYNNGALLTPAINITFRTGNGSTYTLVKDTDYTVTYTGNEKGTEGKAYFAFKGNFSGSFFIYYNIVGDGSEETNPDNPGNEDPNKPGTEDPGNDNPDKPGENDPTNPDKPGENDPTNPDKPDVTDPTNPDKPGVTDPTNPDKPGVTDPTNPDKPANDDTDVDSPDKNDIVNGTITKGKLVYKITNSKKKEVALVKGSKATGTVKVPAAISVNGSTYKVTSIGNKAFNNNKKIKAIVLPKTVKKIGKSTFAGCKKLKTITIGASSAISIGKNAIKGINKKAVIKVPKKLVKKYKKKFKKSTGFKKTMKLKKK